MNLENFAEIDAIEMKRLSCFCGGGDPEKKGSKKKGKNFIKLLKTNVRKMAAFRLSTISMKTNELNSSFHDVDEKRGLSKRSAMTSISGGYLYCRSGLR
jgi:hypothetical protein